MTDSTLPHASDDCAADFVLDGRRGAGTWRCQCGAAHPSTPENDRKADREWALGKLAANQAMRYRMRHIIDAPPDRPPPIIEFPKPEEPKEPWQG